MFLIYFVVSKCKHAGHLCVKILDAQLDLWMT